MFEQIRSMFLSSTGFLRLQAKKEPSIDKVLRPKTSRSTSCMRCVKYSCVSSSAICLVWSQQPSSVMLIAKITFLMIGLPSDVGSRLYAHGAGAQRPVRLVHADDDARCQSFRADELE